MAAIKPDEISSIIREKIQNFDSVNEVTNVGTVLEIGDGISRIYGLKNVMASELVEFQDEDKTLGITLNLEEDNVGVVILGDYTKIKEGMQVKSTGKIASIPVGDNLIGRIIDPTGKPIDGKGDIESNKTRPIERVAPGIITRKSVHQPLQTGLTAIDALTPIGRGQRELIIGDRQTGKTAIAVDTILNQKGQDVICIYVAIGQKTSTVAQLAKTLEEHGAMEYSIIVSAAANESAPLQYIAPFAGCAIGEEFLEPEPVSSNNPVRHIILTEDVFLNFIQEKCSDLLLNHLKHSQALMDIMQEEKSRLTVKDLEHIFSNYSLINDVRVINLLTLSILYKELNSPFFDELEQDSFEKIISILVKKSSSEQHTIERLLIRAIKKYIRGAV